MKTESTVSHNFILVLKVFNYKWKHSQKVMSPFSFNKNPSAPKRLVRNEMLSEKLEFVIMAKILWELEEFEWTIP